MSVKPVSNEAKQVVYVNPYDDYDKEQPIKNNAPVAVCRVRIPGNFLRGNVVGDRVTVEPKKAQWLAKQGALIVEVASVLPTEIKAAGGVDKYLAANPKADKLTKSDRRKLKPIPGIPDETMTAPWEFEEVE